MIDILTIISYLILLVISCSIIFLERKSAEKTIAWLLVFVVLPPVGIFLYVFVGRNWKRRRLSDERALKELRELIKPILRKDKYKKYTSLVNLVTNNSESPVFYNNKIKIYKDGCEKFKEFKEDLLSAKNNIHLEYYIVNSDELGNEIKDILIQKVKEGVEIRFIIDKMGSAHTKKRFIDEMKENGIDVEIYSYFLAPFLRLINTQVNYRNHRKIAVIDGKIGYIGGINIGNEYLGKGKLGYWRDTALRIEGEAVLGLQGFFLDDYIDIKNVNKSKMLLPRDIKSLFPSFKERYDESLVQFVKSGPNSEYPNIMHAILKMITMATKKINITTPYFVPNESIMEALKIAILSGVDVKIVFPGRGDHFLVHYASRTYLYELVKCGAKVYFYKEDSFVHSKVITIDGAFGSVGSANMDIRSFELNYEANAIVYDENVIQELDRQFYYDIKESRLLDVDYFENSNRKTKMLESFSRILSSLL
ncbi:MAG: cardiolipin synthase [Clostridiaceae bacterium]